MPTGYTADIEKGISFQQFAMNCARQFGALVMMREEPHDATIPEKFVPSDYSLKALKKAECDLEALDQITPDYAEQCAIEEYEKEVSSHRKYLEKKSALKKKYLAMLKSVEAWEPPTEDHEGLKKFMVDQITQSIKFDCSDYPEEKKVKLSGAEWIERKRGSILKNIEYHSKDYREECEHTAIRNKWVSDLRNSLVEEHKCQQPK